MKLLKRLGLLTLCLMLGICGAAAEEAAPEKLSGIDMILISASDLEDSLNFFVNHMELNVVARGTLDAPVVMRGDRTDRMFAYLPYDNTPGRWEGLWFHTGSQGNVMQYVDLHSGNYGIRCDSTDLSPLVLLMENSVVHNLRGDGLHLEHSSAEVANPQVSNTLGSTVFLHGGSYSFVHCTFAQFYALSADRGPAVFLANDMEGRYLHLQQAWFHNCVATGYGDDVL